MPERTLKSVSLCQKNSRKKRKKLKKLCEFCVKVTINGKNVKDFGVIWYRVSDDRENFGCPISGSQKICPISRAQKNCLMTGVEKTG
jgi:hypothetical protein